jgi:hypothetical protein
MKQCENSTVNRKTHRERIEITRKRKERKALTMGEMGAIQVEEEELKTLKLIN